MNPRIFSLSQFQFTLWILVLDLKRTGFETWDFDLGLTIIIAFFFPRPRYTNTKKRALIRTIVWHDAQDLNFCTHNINNNLQSSTLSLNWVISHLTSEKYHHIAPLRNLSDAFLHFFKAFLHNHHQDVTKNIQCRKGGLSSIITFCILH